MERNSQDSDGYKLESQIREAFGRVTYTQTCHEKMSKRFLLWNNRIKIGQIVLSSLTTGSFLITILSDEKKASFIGAIFSILLLILNTYVKDCDLSKRAQSHIKAADSLWKIREEYVTLLTDFEILDVQCIREKRNELQNKTAEIYSNSPRTDAKSYEEAKEALKTDEEQTFSEKEIDVMLPNSIRRCNRN